MKVVYDVTQLVELLRCVRRWLIRPVRARKPLPHVEQKWVGVILAVLVALALRAALFCSA